MKKKILEVLYDQIKDKVDSVGKGYDAECATIACNAFDNLTSAEKLVVYREIRELAPKAGTNSAYYGKAAIIANLILFHVESWERSIAK